MAQGDEGNCMFIIDEGEAFAEIMEVGVVREYSAGQVRFANQGFSDLPS
jgi:hypothetical protein